MLTGPDVSNYQGQVDWQQVARAGHSFAACKATEGRSYLDPSFGRNWAGIKAAGLVRIAYHFAHPDRNTPDVEAAWFLAHVKLEPGDLVMLDYETAPYQLGWARTFAARVAVPTVLYYPASQAAAFNGWSGERWPASYGKQAAKPWRFWQYTDRATVPGVPGACDCSYFDGTLTDLHALAGVTPTQQQPQPPRVYDYPEDTVKTAYLNIGPIGPDGNGWTNWDPGFGRDPVPVGEPCQAGPRPASDGAYWTDQAATKIRCAPESGHLVVSVTGGKPGSTVGCWVSAA